MPARRMGCLIPTGRQKGSPSALTELGNLSVEGRHFALQLRRDRCE